MEWTRLFLSVLCLLPALPAIANTTAIPDLPRVTQPIEIAGKLDDDAWRHALQIDVNKVRPWSGSRNGSKPSTVSLSDYSGGAMGCYHVDSNIKNKGVAPWLSMPL